MLLIFIFSPGKTIYVANCYANPVVFAVLALIGSFSIVFVARVIDLIEKKQKYGLKSFLCFLGKNSIVLLAVHSALGICRSSWDAGIFGFVIELGLLIFFLYLFSGPFKTLISIKG